MQTLKNCFVVSALAIGLSFSIAGYGDVSVNPPEPSQKEGVKIVPDRSNGTVQVAPPQKSRERARQKRGDAQRDGVGVVPERKRGNATVLGRTEEKAMRNAEAKRKAEAKRNAARDRKGKSGTVEVR